MSVRLTPALVALAVAALAQGDAVTISGSLITDTRQPVRGAQIEARERSGTESARRATSAPDGSYVVRDLPPGTYNLKITATAFFSTEVRDVQLGGGTLRLPAIPMEWGMFACGTNRPDYYRLNTESVELGAVAGVVVSDTGVPIDDATVTLYTKNKGRIKSQKTARGGRFRFAGLRVQSEEHWVTIEHEDFFVEELGRLFIVPGLESVYARIRMDSCIPGRCQPYLKTIRVIPSCA